MKKKIIALVLSLLMLCAIHVPALASETAGFITASYSNGRVAFSGTVPDGVRAVAVLLFGPNSNQMAMTTCAVTGEGTFSGSMSARLNSGSYAVKAADYEGGEYFAEAAFNWTTPSSTSSSPGPVTVPAPVTEVNSGESLTEPYIGKLVSSGESLTVVGENGARLVFDTNALQGISEQSSENVEVNITDLSDEYQQTHPGKLVYSLTVSSGDKVITDFGGSVTVTLPYQLKEGESPEDVKVWLLTESGVLVEIPCTYDPVTKTASFTVSHFSVYMVGVASSWESPFTDVSETDWFYDAVRFAHENGLMVGTGDTAFSPQVNISRGMVVTILWRLEGKPETVKPITFTDVQEGKWYYKAVAWAADKGIVGGYSADKFGPDDAITREQMAKILYVYADYKNYDVSARKDLSAFTDSPSAWARDSVQWAVAESLIQGKDGGLLDSKSGTKRCECAAILQRFIAKHLR